MNSEQHKHQHQLETLAGQPVSILGLGNHPQMEPRCIPVAQEGGINYFFCYNLHDTKLHQELKRLMAHQREQIVVAIGSETRNLKQLRQELDRMRQLLNTDIVDVFWVEYVSPSDEMKQVETLLAELHQWKNQGLIRYVGATTHNGRLARELIESEQCEVLMHRYNMAHRKAEQEVFPTALQREIPVIAFTCTRWASLLKGHPNWQGKIPTASDCYRFALSQPSVRLALTAPQTTTELKENLKVLDMPLLTPAEVSYWQEYGHLIYGQGKDEFETKWL